MNLFSKYKNQKFEIVEDLPDVGFYLYVYDEKNNCIADHLQNTEKDAKEFAFEEYEVPLKSWTETIAVMCCFCGESLNLKGAVQLSLSTAIDPEESQTIFSHKKCLDTILHKSVVRHPDLI